jgi:hypothetical protein
MSTVSVVVGVVLLRILGFACMNIGLRTPSALAVVYVAWGLVVALGLFAIGRGTAVEVENSLNFAGLRDRLLAKISRPAVRH